MSRRSQIALVAAGAVLWPATAHAHLVSTGLGPFYDGISHLARSPYDLLAVAAVALLAGLHGVASCRHALFALCAAWLAGGLAALALGDPRIPDVVTAGAFLATGMMAAADVRLGTRGVAGVAAAVGALLGWTTGVDLRAAAGELLELAGGLALLFVTTALATAFVVSRRAAWARIAWRVAGSWLAAIGLLVLGWALRAR